MTGAGSPDEASHGEPTGHQQRSLVLFVVDEAGAVMACRYCQHQQRLRANDVPQQVLLFQESHFACDPHLASAGPATPRVIRPAPTMGWLP